MQRPGRGLLLCATPAANASRAHAENAALKYSGGIQRESVKGNEQKVPAGALLGLLKYAGRAGPCLLPPGVVPPRERAWPRVGGDALCEWGMVEKGQGEETQAGMGRFSTSWRGGPGSRAAARGGSAPLPPASNGRAILGGVPWGCCKHTHVPRPPREQEQDQAAT